MNDPREDLEQFWETILGRDPEKIRALWQILTVEERIAIHAHLERMAHEDGWTPSQRVSAHTALTAISEWKPEK